MLTEKRRRFVEFYAIHGNATRAAIEAGYSRRSAPQLASATLMNHEVQESLRQALHRQQMRFIADVEAAQDALRDVMLNAPVGSLAKVQAALGILDRAGHRPVKRLQAHVRRWNPELTSSEAEQNAIIAAALATGKVVMKPPE